MKKLTVMAASAVFAISLSGCKLDELKSNSLASDALGDAVSAMTVTEAEVIDSARLSAAEMDKKVKVAPANSKYRQRLSRLVSKHQTVQGVTFNFKVYENEELNAFAMPDGTVRIYSGLMDKMNDQELLSVIGHEIGHVILKHSFNQYKSTLLTSAARKGLSASGGKIGEYARSEAGELAETFVGAHFSQEDELAADTFGVKFMKQNGYNANAMVSAFQKLQRYSGEGGGFFSSHPSTSERIEKIKAQL